MNKNATTTKDWVEGNSIVNGKKAKKMAEYIFQIYDYIIEARYENDR